MGACASKPHVEENHWVDQVPAGADPVRKTSAVKQGGWNGVQPLEQSFGADFVFHERLSKKEENEDLDEPACEVLLGDSGRVFAPESGPESVSNSKRMAGFVLQLQGLGSRRETEEKEEEGEQVPVKKGGWLRRQGSGSRSSDRKNKDPSKRHLSMDGSHGETSSMFGASLAQSLRGAITRSHSDSSMSSVEQGMGVDAAMRNLSGSRITIIAFEIATLVARMINLKNSLKEDDIEELEKEVLSSEGVQALVSSDLDHLWKIAAEDKRTELRVIARDVARLGLRCGDSAFADLAHKFNSLGSSEGASSKLSDQEMEVHFENLQNMAKSSADLYHEINKLKTMESNLEKRESQEKVGEKKRSGTGDKDYVGNMKKDLKAQEKVVRTLKRKSLWNKKLNEVVGLLVEAVVHLYTQMRAVFGENVLPAGGLMEKAAASAQDQTKLGVMGLGVHYANTVNIIDGLVLRPFSYDRLRHTLYSMLLPSTRLKLKKALMTSHSLMEESIDALQDTLEEFLDWLVIMSGNTIRYQTEQRLQGHTDLALLQTLYHAQFRESEDLLVHLLVHLNHFVAKSQSEAKANPIPKKLAVTREGAAHLPVLDEDGEHLQDASPRKTIKFMKEHRIAVEDQKALDELPVYQRVQSTRLSKSLQFFQGRKGGMQAHRRTVGTGSFSINKKDMLAIARAESVASTNSPRYLSKCLSRKESVTSGGGLGESPSTLLGALPMTPGREDIDLLQFENDIDDDIFTVLGSFKGLN